MENGTFASHNILKNLTFQRRPKALVWSKQVNVFGILEHLLTIMTNEYPVVLSSFFSSLDETFLY